jgi:hypothetical protein
MAFRKGRKAPSECAKRTMGDREKKKRSGGGQRRYEIEGAREGLSEDGMVLYGMVWVGG